MCRDLIYHNRVRHAAAWKRIELKLETTSFEPGYAGYEAAALSSVLSRLVYTIRPKWHFRLSSPILFYFDCLWILLNYLFQSKKNNFTVNKYLRNRMVVVNRTTCKPKSVLLTCKWPKLESELLYRYSFNLVGNSRIAICNTDP